MSLSFSNTTLKNGIIQGIERTLGLGDGTITGNSQKFAEWTADINLAYDKVLAIIFKAGGTWNFDDSNQTDYPIITSALVSGQRDYSFTNDGSGNLILDIFRVFARQSPAGIYIPLDPVDVQSQRRTWSFTDGLNYQGTPWRYDKTANGVFIDPVPNYNSADGLKIYINREAVYFSVSDTTKKPGIAGLFHRYFIVEPVFQFAVRNGYTNVVGFQNEMLRLEQDIANWYGTRGKDDKRVLRGKEDIFR